MTHTPKNNKVVNTSNIESIKIKKALLINKINDSKANYVNLNRLFLNEKPGYWIKLLYVSSNEHKGKYANTREYHFEDLYFKKYQLLSSSRSIYEISVVLDKGDKVQLSSDDEKSIEIDYLG